MNRLIIRFTIVACVLLLVALGVSAPTVLAFQANGGGGGGGGGTAITSCTGDLGSCTQTGAVLAAQVINGSNIASGTIPNAALVTAPLTAASTLDATKLSGAIPSAVTATTQAAGDSSTKLSTTAFAANLVKSPPGGRLTLVSATPVMVSDQTAKGTIFYDTYVFNTVPVAGANLIIGSDEISLILDATNQTSGNLYDVFAINVSGTLTLCAGPAWTNSTTRSAAIALSAGVWTNSGSMANCFNNAVNKGTIAANAGTYLGTFYATANGQTGMQFSPAAASGGANTILGLYNAYNQVAVSSNCLDSKASWNYATATWRAADASNSNRITYVDGLAQVQVVAQYLDVIGSNGGGSNFGTIGINLNSTSATPKISAQGGGAASFNPWLAVTANFTPVLGLNFIQAMEYAQASDTFFGSDSGSGANRQELFASLMM